MVWRSAKPATAAAGGTTGVASTREGFLTGFRLRGCRKFLSMLGCGESLGGVPQRQSHHSHDRRDHRGGFDP